jgi:hypothetical protein
VSRRCCHDSGRRKRVTWYVRSLGGAEDVGLELLPVELGGAGAVLGVDVFTACALNAVVSTYIHHRHRNAMVMRLLET